MPTYEFRCPQGHEFEKFYRTIGGAEAQAVCPECSVPAERVMSAAGFAFKGSGFYLTDYGKNAHRDNGTPDARGATAAEGGSESAKGEKTESKADASASAAPAASGDAKPAAEPKKAESKAADAKPAAAPKKSASE
jgi:putative FmdB family regulatory protein